MRPDLTLRKAKAEDFEFFKRLHHLVLREYVEAIWGWDEQIQHDFARMEFDRGHLNIIECEGQDIGTFAEVIQRPIVKITQLLLMPAYQNRGIGTYLIQEALGKALAKNLILKIHVLKSNKRAKALYEKLGFVVDEVLDDGMFLVHEQCKR